MQAVNSKPGVTRYAVLGTVFCTVGWFLLIFALLGLIGQAMANTPVDTGATLVALLLFALPGFLLARAGHKRRRLVKDLKRYMSVVLTDRNNSIDNMAKHTGEPVEVVQKKLARMLTLNFLPTAGLDLDKRQLVFQSAGTAPAPQQAAPTEHAKVTQVRCPGCGATNSVIGQQGSCEYCASVLTVK